MSIVASLKDARLQRGLSQRELSAKIGLPQSQISKIESGSVDPRASTLIEFARALDMELALIPRKIIPAVRVLGHEAELPFTSRDHAITHDLEKLNATVRKLTASIPQSTELKSLASVVDSLNRLRIDVATASRVRETIAKLRPPVDAIRALRKVHENTSELLSTPAFVRQLKQIAQFNNNLRKVRNTIVHRTASNLPTPTPAYQLDRETIDE
jgi:transcriptional regulator with XRE-family HTH domain